MLYYHLILLQFSGQVFVDDIDTEELHGQMAEGDK